MANIKSDLHTWINTVSSAIAVLAVVFFGGSLWSTVQVHGARLDNLESKGSVTLQRHVDYDNERVDNIKVRVAAMESAITVIGDMKGDLKVIQSKLDKLQNQLEIHERNSVR